MSTTQMFCGLLIAIMAGLLTWHDSWTCALALAVACFSFICVTLIEQEKDDRLKDMRGDIQDLKNKFEAIALNRSFR